jgi:hypothetical protein
MYKTKWEPDLVEEVPTDIPATLAAWSAHATVIMTGILIQGFPFPFSLHPFTLNPCGFFGPGAHSCQPVSLQLLLAEFIAP